MRWRSSAAVRRTSADLARVAVADRDEHLLATSWAGRRIQRQALLLVGSFSGLEPLHSGE